MFIVARVIPRRQDLFTGKAYEDSSPTRATIAVPRVTKRDLFLMDVTPEGYASLLDEATGAARADLQLPAPGARLRARIEAALGAGLEVTVVVTAARRGEGDLALGDALGASLADASLSLGIGPLVAPTLVTASLVVRGGLATAALVALVTVALLVRGRHTRGTGVFMVAGWLALVPMLVSAS